MKLREIVSSIIKEKLDKLKGGKGDGKSIEDLANSIVKSNPKEKLSNVLSSLRSELKKGIKHESEHTSDKSIAKEIAIDHLSENPKYYSDLASAKID